MCDESLHTAKHKIWDKSRFHVEFHPILMFFLASLSWLCHDFFVTSSILPKPKVLTLCLTNFMDNFNESKLKSTNRQVLFVFILKIKQFCDVAKLEFIHKRNYPNFSYRSERKVEKMKNYAIYFSNLLEPIV
jgi:hypothetical protein